MLLLPGRFLFFSLSRGYLAVPEIEDNKQSRFDTSGQHLIMDQEEKSLSTEQEEIIDS